MVASVNDSLRFPFMAQSAGSKKDPLKPSVSGMSSETRSIASGKEKSPKPIGGAPSRHSSMFRVLAHAIRAVFRFGGKGASEPGSPATHETQSGQAAFPAPASPLLDSLYAPLSVGLKEEKVIATLNYLPTCGKAGYSELIDNATRDDAKSGVMRTLTTWLKNLERQAKNVGLPDEFSTLAADILTFDVGGVAYSQWGTDSLVHRVQGDWNAASSKAAELLRIANELGQALIHQQTSPEKALRTLSEVRRRLDSLESSGDPGEIDAAPVAASPSTGSGSVTAATGTVRRRLAEFSEQAQSRSVARPAVAQRSRPVVLEGTVKQMRDKLEREGVLLRGGALDTGKKKTAGTPRWR